MPAHGPTANLEKDKVILLVCLGSRLTAAAAKGSPCFGRHTDPPRRYNEPMFQVDTPLGNLVLVRWTSLREVTEATAFRSAIQSAVLHVKPAVICADWRAASLVSPDVAEVMGAMLRGTNPHLKRSAILLAPEHATFSLQTERLVREAQNPQRRTFRAVPDQLQWLGEVLTPQELERARHFLAPTP